MMGLDLSKGLQDCLRGDSFFIYILVATSNDARIMRSRVNTAMATAWIEWEAIFRTAADLRGGRWR